MESTYKIYGTNHCPYCIRARGLLESKSIAFEDIDLTENDALRDELVAKLNYHTVPMIFKGEEFIGGYAELQQLDADGAL